MNGSTFCGTAARQTNAGGDMSTYRYNALTSSLCLRAIVIANNIFGFSSLPVWNSGLGLMSLLGTN